MNRITKKAAIAYALTCVNGPFGFRKNYKISWYDKTVNAWRESFPMDYDVALHHRKEHLIQFAREFRKKDIIICHPDIIAGKWQNHI